MFPSNGFVNMSSAFTHYNDYNPCSIGIQDFTSSWLFDTFSPPYIYEDAAIYTQHLHALLHQTAQGFVATNGIEKSSLQIDASISTDQLAVAKKKVSRNNDRHTKIETANGLKPTRMRLSLDAARNLFGLQERLGFKKASQTVEWLLNQAEDPIKELINGGLPHMTVSTASPTSDCVDDSILSSNISSKAVLPSTCTKKKRSRSLRKPTFRKPTFNKESREKARERARERTTSFWDFS